MSSNPDHVKADGTPVRYPILLTAHPLLILFFSIGYAIVCHNQPVFSFQLSYPAFLFPARRTKPVKPKKPNRKAAKSVDSLPTLATSHLRSTNHQNTMFVFFYLLLISLFAYCLLYSQGLKKDGSPDKRVSSEHGFGGSDGPDPHVEGCAALSPLTPRSVSLCSLLFSAKGGKSSGTPQEEQ